MTPGGFSAARTLRAPARVLWAALLCAALASCASTPILGAAIPEAYTPEVPEGRTPSIEFIGFKANLTLLAVSQLLGGGRDADISYSSDYLYWKKIRDSAAISAFSRRLEQARLAVPAESLYFGDFTPQDLQVYSGELRYVSFVDVFETRYSYKDTAKTQHGWAMAGAGLLLGGGVGLLSAVDEHGGAQKAAIGVSAAAVALGTASFIPSLFTPKTTLTFGGRYALCVYDTHRRRLVARREVRVALTEHFTGSLESPRTDTAAVYERYGQILANELTAAYEAIAAGLPD